MPRKKSGGIGRYLENFSKLVCRWTGGSSAFAMACGIIVVWLITGPLFGYSDTWQLVINTGTTVVTFLMVFLIQRSQNKESLAVQLKLNELVAAVRGASNRLINVEDLSETDIRALHSHFQTLVDLSRHEENLTASHSIEEARHRHRAKKTPLPDYRPSRAAAKNG